MPRARTWMTLSQAASELEVGRKAARRVLASGGVRVRRLPGMSRARFLAEDVRLLAAPPDGPGASASAPERQSCSPRSAPEAA